MSTLARSLRIGRELARIGSAIVAERVRTGYVFNPLLNPLLRQAREWPYPLYQRLREHDPVHRSRAIRGWFLFRHADCLAVLRDGRFSADDRNYAGYAQQRAWEIADGLADPNQPDEPPMLRRRFAATTNGLLALADCLTAHGCSHVAMEATGVYWKPIWHVLESDCVLVLANAQHIRNVPGRTTASDTVSLGIRVNCHRIRGSDIHAPKAARCLLMNSSRVVGGRPPIVSTRSFVPAKIPF